MIGCGVAFGIAVILFIGSESCISLAVFLLLCVHLFVCWCRVLSTIESRLKIWFVKYKLVKIS